MLLIYAAKKTPRLNYIFEFIFKDILKTKYQLTTDKEAFRTADEEVKISYASQPVGDELFFYATPLLFEKGLREQTFKTFDFEGTKAFYTTTDRSALPFDPFAAAFYLVTRYEEYFPFKTDRFGRFPATESLAHKKGFLQDPVIDIWAYAIKKAIKQKYPAFSFVQRHYSFLPTYDIDSAFAYKHKGVLRTLGGYAVSIANQNWSSINLRTKVLLGKAKDPYDTFNWLFQQHQKYNLQPIYFFLVGDYGEYDRNISINIQAFQSLIKSVGDHAQIGIHPSYASNEDESKLRSEIQRLRRVVKREVTLCRQHFLKLNLPTTYQHLIEAEIEADFTMGFADQPGFRAGTCTPFHFYDLDFETKTKLKVYPFAVMDATLRHYLEVTPKKAIQINHQLVDKVKKVNGQFISLWHNSSISEDRDWKGWRTVYTDLLAYASHGR